MLEGPKISWKFYLKQGQKNNYVMVNAIASRKFLKTVGLNFTENSASEWINHFLRISGHLFFRYKGKMNDDFHPKIIKSLQWLSQLSDSFL